jgi:3-dehydroquinate dehydratase type I
VTRNHDPESSIALVGIRGTGLSTLAVMAASALDFRLIDADHHFYQVTGLSRAKFKSVHGTAKYRHEEMTLLHSMLLGNVSRAIIVCGPGAVETTGQALLAEYARTHPVIYVTRDIQGIQDHLRVWNADQIEALLDRSAPTLRSVSNFEFHNLSHLNDPGLQENLGPGHRSPRSLALKQVEHDFLQLVHSTSRRHGVACKQQFLFSSISVEARPFTYALILPAPVPDTLWANIRYVDTLADAVELVISYSELCAERPMFSNSAANYITRQFYAARRNIQLPIILHIQFHHTCSTEGLEWYFDILHHGLRLAPDFLCVNLACDQDLTRRLVAAKGATKIIAHHYDPNPSPAGWDAQEWKDKVALAERLGADMIRLCQEATCTADNFAVRHFVDQATASMEHNIPIIAYNTGSLGKMSRYFNSVLSPVTDTFLEADSMPHPWNFLFTIRQAQSALYSSLLLDPLYFGIYGNNVAGSLSPAMHNAAFQVSGMPHVYKVFQHSTLKELEAILSDPNLGGVSVTAPFKSEVMKLVDYMSREAQTIGAVNTLVPLRSATMSSLLDRNRAGPAIALYGDNTDWVGVKNCVQHNLSPINAIKRRTTALVVGAGGMARAATYALIRLGIRNIFIHNRTKQRAETLISHFHERSPDVAATPPTMTIIEGKTDAWPENADHPTIIVSCVATSEVNGQSSVDTSLPPTWLASPTGGVVIEVRACGFLP